MLYFGTLNTNILCFVLVYCLHRNIFVCFVLAYCVSAWVLVYVLCIGVFLSICISVAVYRCIPQHKYCYMLCISVLRLSISISVYAVYRCIDSVQAIYKPRLPPPLFLPLQPYNIRLCFNRYLHTHTNTYRYIHTYIQM